MLYDVWFLRFKANFLRNSPSGDDIEYIFLHYSVKGSALMAYLGRVIDLFCFIGLIYYTY